MKISDLVTALKPLEGHKVIIRNERGSFEQDVVRACELKSSQRSGDTRDCNVIIQSGKWSGMKPEGFVVRASDVEGIVKDGDVISIYGNDTRCSITILTQVARQLELL